MLSRGEVESTWWCAFSSLHCCLTSALFQSPAGSFTVSPATPQLRCCRQVKDHGLTSRTGFKILLCVHWCLGCSYKELGEANSWVTCASPSWCPCWDSIRATQPWLACLELGHVFTASGLQCCLSLNVRKVEVEHSLAINTVSSDVYWINYV